MPNCRSSHERAAEHDSGPAYRRVKEHVLGHILAEDWAIGERIPSEHELRRQFGVSRMTVHRAIRELTDEGYLSRTVGAGTFVAQRSASRSSLLVRDIMQEMHDAGLKYRTHLTGAVRERASAEAAARLGVAPGALIYRSSMVYWAKGAPIQYEERWVNAVLAPDYLDHDFERTAPAGLLTRLAPDVVIDHEVRAIIAKGRVRTLLAMQPGEPCLLLTSRMRVSDAVLSVADLYHPGARYALPGRIA